MKQRTEYIIYFLISLVITGSFITISPIGKADTTNATHYEQFEIQPTPTQPHPTNPQVTKPTVKPTKTVKPTPNIRLDTPTPTPNITQPVTQITIKPQQTIKSIVLGTSILPNATNVQPPLSITRRYPYAKDRYITFTTNNAISDDFVARPEYFFTSPETEIILPRINDDIQDQYLTPLVDTIRQETPDPKGQALIAIGFVQHIPFDYAKAKTTSTEWAFPYTTIHTNSGICADKSLLLAYLLKELGYRVVLFNFEDKKTGGHMAVGIRTDGAYDFKATGYAYIETTTPTIPTYIPTDFVNGFEITDDFTIVQVNQNGLKINLYEENQDAQSMKAYESAGKISSGDYADYVTIQDRYDLTYETT